MNYFTGFEIGLWNAWIPAWLLSISVWVLLFNNKKAMRRLSDYSYLNKSQKKLVNYATILNLLFLLVAIWTPLHFPSILFNVSGISFLLFYLISLIAYRNFITTPGNKYPQTGLYKMSRNPIYFSTTLVFISIVIASKSGILLIITILHFMFTHKIILLEEKQFSKKLGKHYLKYLEKTSRYFLFF